MPLPDLIIGGAPKCGTSSVAGWLTAHPDVCRSEEKEPFYLMDPGHPLERRDASYHRHGLEGYSSLFAHCSDARVVFEATTHYLYQRTAMEVIGSLPGARAVFILRAPHLRVWSSFRFSQGTLAAIPSETSFADYVDAALAHDERRLRELLGGSRSAWVLERDVLYGQYVDFLEPWLAKLGFDRVRLMVFEEVIAEPVAAMAQLADWLGIDGSFFHSASLPARNRTVEIRAKGLHRIARGVRRLLPAKARVPGMLRSGYNALQQTPSRVRPTAADEAALTRLQRYYRPFNERLRLETGTEISRWHA